MHARPYPVLKAVLTLGQLAELISRLPRDIQGVEIRLVTGVREAERGPFEGGTIITSSPVASVCVAVQGVFLFLDQDTNRQREERMPQVPPGFSTGDHAFDKKHRPADEDEDLGEEWKK